MKISNSYKKILILGIFLAALALLIFNIWQKQTAISGGRSPLYRNLRECPTFVRKGFDPSDFSSQVSSEYSGFSSMSRYIKSSNLPNLPKKTFLSPVGIQESEFTIKILVEVDREAVSFMRSNTAFSPGIYIPGIGENWEIFFNGSCVISQMHLDEEGKITERRVWRDVFFPVDHSLLVSGTNVLTIRIIGDPSYQGTGIFQKTAPFYIDDYSVIEKRQYNFLFLILTGIFCFTGAYYILLFFSIRNKREIFNLYFGIFSIFLGVYAMTRHSLINYLIPNTDILIRLEYFSIMLAIPVLCLFIETIWRGKISRVVWISFALCVILGLSQIFSCLQYGEEVIRIWNIIVILCYSYIFFYDIIYFYFIKKQREGFWKDTKSGADDASLISILFGSVAIYFCGIFDIMDGLFLGYALNLFVHSVFVIHIGMTFALSQRFSGMYRQLEQSNVMLETAVRERTLELEKQTRIAVQASRVKSELFAGMSHEMRTPLTVMSTYAQFAVEQIKESGANEQTLADLAAISDEAKRLAEMADGTLKILMDTVDSDKSAQKITSVNVGDLSSRLVRLLSPIAARKEKILSALIADNVPLISGDADALTQLLWNLLQNAITHSQAKTIELLVETYKEAERKGGVKIAVKDDGIGIEPDILPRIFERGVSGRTGGSGIGLAICREIANKHGGDINVESALGSGTCVTVILKGIIGG